MPTDAEEIFPHIKRWKSSGQGVALATVVQTWGSLPRPEGSHLAVNERGEFVGSVSGGCLSLPMALAKNTTSCLRVATVRRRIFKTRLGEGRRHARLAAQYEKRHRIPADCSSDAQVVQPRAVAAALLLRQ